MHTGRSALLCTNTFCKHIHVYMCAGMCASMCVCRRMRGRYSVPRDYCHSYGPLYWSHHCCHAVTGRFTWTCAMRTWECLRSTFPLRKAEKERNTSDFASTRHWKRKGSGCTSRCSGYGTQWPCTLPSCPNVRCRLERRRPPFRPPFRRRLRLHAFLLVSEKFDSLPV